MLPIDLPRMRDHVLIVLARQEPSHGFRIARAGVKVPRVLVAAMLDPLVEQVAAPELISHAEKAEGGMVPVSIENAVQFRSVECVAIRNPLWRSDKDRMDGIILL